MFECYNYKTQLATITKNTFHGLNLQGISHLHVCYYSHRKEVEHKCFLPFDFQIVLWACNLLMFSFNVFIFWILLFLFCLKTKVYFTFLRTFFFHYILPENFKCIFTYHISIFKRLDHFQFPHENTILKWRKKPNRCMINWNSKTCAIT